MSWTKKERVMAVLSGEIPDRIPIYECLLNDGILEHFGGKPIAAGDKEALTRACSGCLDISHPIFGPYEPGEVILPDGKRKVYERWTEWTIPLHGRTLENMLENIKKEIEEFEAYKPDVNEVRQWKKHAKEMNGFSGDMVYIHVGVELAILPDTMEEGIYLYADYPELVLRWNKVKNRKHLLWLDAIADSEDSPVMIIWNDLGIKGRLIYPEYMLEKLFYPALRDACELIHSKGMKVLFHCDGNVNEIMESLVQFRIDAFNPLEISSGMDYASYKEKFGKRVPLVGGLDAVEILALGSVDRVVEETKRLISIAGKDGGLIAGSASGEIDNSMPPENVLAYFETVWKYGVYK